MINSKTKTFFVLNSLKDNTVQERLSGNFQKELFARLMAEKGIFTTYNTLVDNLADNPDATLAQLSEGVVLKDSAENFEDTGYTVTAPSGSLTAITVGSAGKRNEGEKTLNAVFAPNLKRNSSP